MHEAPFCWPSTDTRLQTVSFDLYERYSIAASFVQAFRKSPNVSVLDVGGHSSVLWPGFESLVSAFIPDAQTFVTDLHREPGLNNYAVASGTQLPFKDGSFDFVLAQDTLEHVPPGDRERFVKELLRVSREIVLLSFPFLTPLNSACDSLVYRYIKARKNVELPALREHLELGLPDLATITEWLHRAGLRFSTWTHGNTLVWLQMMLAQNHLWTQGVPELEQELNSAFNVQFAAGDYAEPCYRSFVLIAKSRSTDELRAHLARCRGEQLPPSARQEIYSLCQTLMAATSSVELERRSQHSINLLEGFRSSLAEHDRTGTDILLDRDTRLAEASSRADHLGNLLEQQRQRAADLENRLAETSSEAEHYRNLLGEQQPRLDDAINRLAEATSRAADLENRLAETSSEAGHCRNLLGEQQPRLDDAINRLAEATSRAADLENRLAETSSEAEHCRNLLGEQQPRLDDAINRLAEASSRADHLGNLLEQQRQRAADLENRLAKTNSEAEHYRNLLDEQQPHLDDAINRLAEATSRADHLGNLLEQQRQRAADFENRLAKTSSEAQHYRNLLDEQQPHLDDAINRLAEASSRADHLGNLLEQQRQRAADLENRLAKTNSEAQHYRNLLDQQESRFNDAINRLAEASSRADHFGNLLEQQTTLLEAATKSSIAAEQELGILRARLGRFPARLFVRLR
jgi:chromosome segregation ATPase